MKMPLHALAYQLRNCLVVICFGLLGSSVYAATYHVRNGGNDNNSGLDDANAWASLAKVGTVALNPGDSVLFKKGSVWTDASLTVANVSGTSTNYITFGSYGTDPARPKILRNLPRDGYGMKFTDCSYIRIQGFDVGRAGIGIWVNTASAAQAGIVIDDCYIHDIYGYNYYYPSTVLPGQYPMAINVTGVDGLTITNCTSYNAGSFCGFTGTGPKFGTDPNHIKNTTGLPTPILNKNVYISNCVADRNIYYGLVILNMVNGLVENCTVTRAGSMPMVNGSIGIMLGDNNGVTVSNVTVEKTDKYFFMSSPGVSGTTTAPDGGGIDYEVNNQDTDIDGCTVVNNSQEGVMLYNNGGSIHNTCDITNTVFKFNNLTPSQTRPEIWFSQSNSNNNSFIQDNTYWLMPGKSFISTGINSSVTVSNNTNSTATEAAPTVPAAPTGFAKLYDFSTGLEGWTFSNFKYSGQHGKYWGGFAGGIFANGDPYMVSPDNMGVNITTNKWVLIRFRNLSAATTAKIYFSTTASTTFSEAKSVSFSVNPYDAADTEYVVDMSGNSAWTGTLKQLRFDPTGNEWDMVDINYIGITGPAIAAWNFDTTAEGWTAVNGISGFAWQSGGFVGGNVTNTDPYCTSPTNLGVDIQAHKTVEIRLKASGGTAAALYFITNASPGYDGSKVKTFSIIGDNTWRTYSVDMSTVAGWTGTLKQLRLDPINPGSNGQTFSVDYVEITY